MQILTDSYPRVVLAAVNRLVMRWLCTTFLIVIAVGCRSDVPAPRSFTSDERQTIKQNLIKRGAKVTAETSDALYMSLRNTHLELRPLGGTIDGTLRVRRDFNDFGYSCEAIARDFLGPNEFEEFKRWLHRALSPQGPERRSVDFEEFKVSLSRHPVRMVFTRRDPAVSEGASP